MEFLVVPGPDGGVQVIEAHLKVSEPVKVRTDRRPKSAVAVPQAARIASFKICTIPAAA